jgi:hypothetical protein
MSPAVLYASSDAPKPAAKFTPSKGPSLVLGSPATAMDGKYQSLIMSLGENRDVERQMLDRLTDGGSFSFFSGTPLLTLDISCDISAIELLLYPLSVVSNRLPSSSNDTPGPPLSNIVRPFTTWDIASL